MLRSFYPVELNSPLLSSVKYTGKLIELHQDYMGNKKELEKIMNHTRELLNIYYKGWQEYMSFENYIERLNGFIEITNNFALERNKELLEDIERTQGRYLEALNKMYSNHLELNQELVNRWINLCLPKVS